MIRLNQTASQLLSLITEQNGATVVVSYSDKSATGYDGDTQVTAITSATTTTICSTPAAATIRDVDHISVRNTYAGSQAVTVQLSSSATLYPLVTISLALGDSLEYTHGSGWRVMDSSGQIKMALAFTPTSHAGLTDLAWEGSGHTGTAGALATFDGAGGAAEVIEPGTNLAALEGDATQAFSAASLNGGPLAGLRNIIVNGGFTINQRKYASGAVLSAGSYGHDRWKAGSGGGDYSFTQLESNTAITISANKTLIQVIENKNIHATRYVVSWTGTALARAGVNSATPSGAYAASPIVITGQTVGTVMSIEFGNGASAGTLGVVQIEASSSATTGTPFENRPAGLELSLCQRYYYRLQPGALQPFGVAYNANTNQSYIVISLPQMRTGPTALGQSGTATDYAVQQAGAVTVCSAVPVFSTASSAVAMIVFTTAGAVTAGHAVVGRAATADAYLGFSAEL
jgi:hypothetical protein